MELGRTRGDAGDLDTRWDQWRRKAQRTGQDQRVHYIHLDWREQFNLRAGVMNRNHLQDVKKHRRNNRSKLKLILLIKLLG